MISVYSFFFGLFGEGRKKRLVVFVVVRYMNGCGKQQVAYVLFWPNVVCERLLPRNCVLVSDDA